MHAHINFVHCSSSDSPSHASLDAHANLALGSAQFCYCKWSRTCALELAELEEAEVAFQDELRQSILFADDERDESLSRTYKLARPPAHVTAKLEKYNLALGSAQFCYCKWSRTCALGSGAAWALFTATASCDARQVLLELARDWRRIIIDRGGGGSHG